MIPAGPAAPGASTGRLLLVRTDAGPEVGGGHVTRCEALASAWRRAGGRATFALPAPPPVVARRLAKAGFEVHETAGDDLASLATGLGAEAVVVDDYRVGADELGRTTSSGPVLLVTDGERRGDVPVDLLLDQNADADADYPARCRGDVLRGPAHVLLRPSFLDATPRPPRASVATVVVVFGASDPQGLGAPVAERLAADLPGVEVVLVRGPLAAPVGAAGARVVVDPPNMAEVLGGADLVVTAAGSTCWEVAHLGVPCVAVVVADNQVAVAEGLRRHGLARVVDDPRPSAIADGAVALAGDPAARAAMAGRGPLLVDGLGADRVVGRLLELTERTGRATTTNR